MRAIEGSGLDAPQGQERDESRMHRRSDEFHPLTDALPHAVVPFHIAFGPPISEP